MANIPKLLHRNPRILRSVYGREEIGLRDQEFQSTVQQRNLQTNEPIIVAEVFGTPGVQTRQPPINYFDQLIQITGQIEFSSQFVHESVICWYEKDNKKLIIIDSTTLPAHIHQIYQMRDSVFPVLLTQNSKRLHQPLLYFPEDFTKGGIYLVLIKSKTKTIENRTVLIYNSRKDIPKVDCSTYAADLVCFVQSVKPKRSGPRLIKCLIDGYNQLVSGIHAPLNQPIDQKLTIEIDRIPDWNHRLSNRFMFIVGNDGYLCINECWSSTIYYNTLLKENTYFLCDGIIDLVNVFGVKLDLRVWISKCSKSYSKSINIIPEGIQYISINCNDCRELDCGQLKSYILGWYYLPEFDTKVLSLDPIQLSNDLSGQSDPVNDYQPVMVLADINDALIYEYQFNSQVVGHILFSLSSNHYEKKLFRDTFSVFICLDETNWSTDYALYQMVGECSVKYQKEWIPIQLDAPKIDFYSEKWNLIKLTDDQLNRWRLTSKRFTDFALYDIWRKFFLPIINTTPVNGWRNVGVNLAERQRVIQSIGLQFPKDYGVSQWVEKKPRVH